MLIETMLAINLGAVVALFGHQIYVSYKLGKVEQHLADLNGALDKRK